MAVATVTPILELVEKVQRYFPQADVDLLERAYMFAQRAHGDQKRVSGEPYVAHPYAAATILALNYGVVELAYRSKRARRLLESHPTLLIHNGRLLQDNLRRERVTFDDLLAALRRNGVTDPAHVRVAVLEENGGISVIPRERASGSSPSEP